MHAEACKSHQKQKQMDIQSIIDSIKNGLQTKDVTDTSKYYCSSDLHIILQKVNYSDELSTRLFLQALREILVFGSFILKYESSIDDFKSLNYQDSKEEVCSFVKKILKDCAFLPVDYHLWNSMVLMLINKEISPKFGYSMTRIFTPELRGVSPGLFNDSMEDLLYCDTERITEILAIYTRVLPQIRFVEKRNCSLKQQKEWMLLQMLAGDPIVGEAAYISSMNHFLEAIEMVMNSSKPGRFRSNWSRIFIFNGYLSHVEYRNLGDWFYYIMNAECRSSEYKLTFLRALLKRSDSVLVSNSPDQDSNIDMFLQTWFFMAQYYPGILGQNLVKLLEVLEFITRYELPEQSRIESMDKVITPHYNMSRLYNDIVTHLYVQYETPYWFCKHLLSGSELERSCFFHLAKGNSLRYMTGLPVHITRKEAYQMVSFTPNQVPATYFENWISLGLLFARLLVNDCAPELLVSLKQHSWQLSSLLNYDGMVDELSTFIINHKEDWSRDNGNGEMLDYVLHMKQENEQYSFRNRDFQTVREQSRRWHEHAAQRRFSSHVPAYWSSVQVDDFKLCTDSLTYHINQITSLKRLHEEGYEMRHCVYSYARQCASGYIAIFSLYAENEMGESMKLVTLQVSNRTIVQAKGKCNRSMNSLERKIVKEWAEEQRLRVAV